MSNLFHDAGLPATGQKVCLATTVYDSPDASYTYAIARSREALHQGGIQTAYMLLSGNCHVDDSRNTVVAEFLASDCSELVFLDADVSWEPEHLVKLCNFDCDIVGGVYPYRREGDKDRLPFRGKAGCAEPKDGLLEVEGLPTGFMRIKRHVLERMALTAKKFRKAGNTIPVIFERAYHSDGRLGGDIGFCLRWVEMGGRVFAAADLRLGHVGKHIITDSLAAMLRRQRGTTLAHIAALVRDGEETPEDYREAIKALDNRWGADVDVLSLAVLLARKAGGPIIEAGSGLTTVLMAAANPDQTVWAMEHSDVYALMLRNMAYAAGVRNIAIVTVPLKDGWYDLSEDRAEMPKKFALGLIDGPPRLMGDRTRFLDELECSVILADDADDAGYADKLKAWAAKSNRPIEIGDRRAAVILQEKSCPTRNAVSASLRAV